MDNNFICMEDTHSSRLKQFRIYMNMTQQQMADILDIRQNTYSRIESGTTTFKDVYKKIIERKYHLTTGWLSGADVPMFEEHDAVAGIIKSGSPISNKEKLKEQIMDELVEQKIGSQNNSVAMSREVFDHISKLTETVLSQQRTIESLQEQIKKMLAQMGNHATCANASGYELEK